MQSEQPETSGRPSATRALTRHFALVALSVVFGAFVGWVYLTSSSSTYTSTARVLVNPSVGNPYAPTPTSVRQDEMTSLETEAQVARSSEVLDSVAEAGLATTGALSRGLQVTVPPNTQILEISYSASDAGLARQVADAVANAYLDNRGQRSEQVNSARIERVETRTQSVVTALRAATAAAQRGTPAERLFQTELAAALRNELVSLRAQQTALENSESPSGEVISPASAPSRAQNLTTLLFPLGGALAGLALGFLLAAVMERFAGVIRSASDVEALGLPVLAAVPPVPWPARMTRGPHAEAFETTIRRVRAKILDLDPRPEVIAVAPAGRRGSHADVAESVAESFAKAGHRVVLVQTDGNSRTKGLGVEEEGLAQALLFERLNVLDLLKPSVEPLLCLLPHGGFTAQSRELLVADRLRAVISPLIKSGHLVVIQSPGVDSPEGEACLGAADLGLVLVRVSDTRPAEVEQVTEQLAASSTPLAALVVGLRGSERRPAGRPVEDIDPELKQEEAAEADPRTRAPR